MQRPFEQTRPARIVVLCDQPPTTNDLEPIFADYLNPDVNVGWRPHLVRIDGTIGAPLNVTATPAVSADDYIAWDHTCQPELENIRQALRRPYARKGIDYEHPFDLLDQNWVAMRVVAQMLAATTQAYLLRGDPEGALRQMTLMHDLRKVMEGPPGGQPVTLVSAMINSAVAGLYASTLQEGLRSHVWGEPQLAALQRQLAELDLPECVERSFRFEQACMPHIIEIQPRSEVMLDALHSADLISAQPAKNWQWNRVGWKLFLEFSPRGWMDQNRAAIARAFEPNIEAFDLSRHPLEPATVDAVAEATKGLNAGFPPYTVLRATATVAFNRSVQTTVKNQTEVNHALIACALEHYHLANHEYPPSLELLGREYLDKIPRDLIGGGPPAYRRVTKDEFELSSAGWNGSERWTWPGR